MRRHRLLARLFLAATFVALSGMRLAAEEQSLMTTDGTLHVVSTGRAIDLGIQDANIPPERYLIEWTAKAQDGTISMAILPHTISSNGKRDLQLAFDEQTGTLVLLWTEDVAYSDVHVGVLRNGVWTNSGLLPTQGIALASNPKMVITHRGVTYLDENDNPVSKTSSILSIVWWEDALIGQARLANVFLDEQSFDTANLTVYDLPTLSGGGGDVSYDGIPSGAYAFPNLQPDGLTGSVLVSFADLHDQTQQVARIDFPTDIGKPSDAANLNWKRRHIPIVRRGGRGPDRADDAESGGRSGWRHRHLHRLGLPAHLLLARPGRPQVHTARTGGLVAVALDRDRRSDDLREGARPRQEAWASGTEGTLASGFPTSPSSRPACAT